MECNKDEAIRAKEIADRKFTERDFSAAKKFALKAQNLYPGLEGVSDMLTALDVYISADNKISGEVDWYGILGVPPLADDDTIKKQYRKLALALHPDKNKYIGADGAFKLVSEAWSLLSDKAKRLVYNQKRNLKGFHQNVPTQSGGPAAPPRPNGFHSFTNSATSNARTQKNAAQAGPTRVSSQSHRRSDTFWTYCHRCKTHYEYLRIYLNHTLLCPNCHEPFLALEKAPPSHVLRSSNWSSHQQHQSPNNYAASTSPTFNPRRNAEAVRNSGLERTAGHSSFSKTDFHSGLSSDSSAVQAANVVRQANERVKREREEAQAAARGPWSHSFTMMGSGLSSGLSNSSPNTALSGDDLFKRRRIDDDRINGFGGNMATSRINGVFGKPNIYREVSQLGIRNMLTKKARMEIHKKLKEWRSATKVKGVDKENEKRRETEKAKQKTSVDGDTHSVNEFGNSADIKKKCQADGSSGSSADDVASSTSMTVPDPDFHNFDVDRAENSFADNQVWASYDDDDGMPRFYAIIHKVISLNPFKTQISWLNSKSNSEFGQLDWIGSGFSKTCGEFRIGKHEINESLNSLSHKVKWTKGIRGIIRIYPRKGDVWALYRNWSPDWNENTPDEVIHKYDMVAVLDDYNEEQGISVTPLIKVAGFRTVFRQQEDPKEVRRIPKEEMFRFSHQVPNYFLTGQEAQNAPKGCQELDPAATPLELLQVIADANEALVEENVGRAEEEIMENGEPKKVKS